METSDIVRRLRQYFERHADGIACAYLFGSTARGEAGRASDVDVAVLLTEDPPATLAGSGVRLEGQLESELGTRVDLVLLNRAPVDLVHRILRDGELVFEADASARVRFEVRARNLWFDLKPILDTYRRVPPSDHG
ncbi:MAG: nucleotidyltransferase domain-containing protein [Burkholderiales bacterium]|nr:MAG: nucleotidyltransferase domain-containing protein [Burkholderiales bacterium]